MLSLGRRLECFPAEQAASECCCSPSCSSGLSCGCCCCGVRVSTHIQRWLSLTACQWGNYQKSLSLSPAPECFSSRGRWSSADSVTGSSSGSGYGFGFGFSFSWGFHSGSGFSLETRPGFLLVLILCWENLCNGMRKWGKRDEKSVDMPHWGIPWKVMSER